MHVQTMAPAWTGTDGPLSCGDAARRFGFEPVLQISLLARTGPAEIAQGSCPWDSLHIKSTRAQRVGQQDVVGGQITVQAESGLDNERGIKNCFVMRMRRRR
jgi:hypothetical protein